MSVTWPKVPGRPQPPLPLHRRLWHGCLRRRCRRQRRTRVLEGLAPPRPRRARTARGRAAAPFPSAFLLFVPPSSRLPRPSRLPRALGPPLTFSARSGCWTRLFSSVDDSGRTPSSRVYVRTHQRVARPGVLTMIDGKTWQQHHGHEICIGRMRQDAEFRAVILQGIAQATTISVRRIAVECLASLIRQPPTLTDSQTKETVPSYAYSCTVKNLKTRRN